MHQLLTSCSIARLGMLLFCLSFGAGSSVTAQQAILRVPGSRPDQELAELTDAQRKLSAELSRDVQRLAGELGERNTRRYESLVKAALYIEAELTIAGYKVKRQEYRAGGQSVWNIEAELAGTGALAAEVIVVGAHYDSAVGATGANDNGSGVAAALALARRFVKERPERTVRFVFFTNEEQPYFQNGSMGSLVYARRSRQRQEKIAAMLCLETLGYYSHAEGSQRYPALLARAYPTTGHFVAVVGNIQSGPLVSQVVKSFRTHTQFRIEGASLPASLPGVGWSDHWSFWQQGYPAIMFTDTALYRYPFYHTQQDTPDKVNYGYLARVVEGIERELKLLARGPLPEMKPAANAGAAAATSADGERPRLFRLFRRRDR